MEEEGLSSLIAYKHPPAGAGNVWRQALFTCRHWKGHRNPLSVDPVEDCKGLANSYRAER
jgi:hypothetical protein